MDRRRKLRELQVPTPEHPKHPVSANPDCSFAIKEDRENSSSTETVMLPEVNPLPTFQFE
jgi:hypothetical protein